LRYMATLNNTGLGNHLLTGNRTMKVEQFVWDTANGWKTPLPTEAAAHWVLAFGHIVDAGLRAEVIAAFPNAVITGCSTAGEILAEEVLDNSLVLTAVYFEKDTRIQSCTLRIDDASTSYDTGAQLTQQLQADDLQYLFVLSEGLNVNGTLLANGLSHEQSGSIPVSGGLSGDGDRFENTAVWYHDTATQDALLENHVVAVGFYGSHLKIAHGSQGGWDPFGPDRKVTRSQNNVLYELDGQSALELYKQYLGDYASGLPATGLLFPLALSGDGIDSDGLVRTILAVNEEDQSMTFAGDVPEGCFARLMRANFDHLVEGASQAAEMSLGSIQEDNAELAILISCVGRKMVLKQRVEEEVESVRDVLGERPAMTGFYSYGEISPLVTASGCALHNQTMTITTLTEV